MTAIDPDGLRPILSALHSSTTTTQGKIWSNWFSQIAEGKALFDVESSVGAEGAVSKEDDIFFVPEPAAAGQGSGIHVITAAFADAKLDLRDARHDARQRSRQAFMAALVVGVVGGIVLLVGIGLLFAGVIGPGLIGTIGGGGAQLVTAWFRNLYRTETNRANELVDDLRRYEQAHLGMVLASQLAGEQRDLLIQRIADSMFVRSSGNQ
jgi:hypothetical protein